MLGSVGAGAITGALLLPRVRTRLGQDWLVLAASLVTGAAIILLALTNSEVLGIVATFVLGMAWIAMLTTLNATTQGILPNAGPGSGNLSHSV
jgi:predicted MFS family arabinose efflux permease